MFSARTTRFAVTAFAVCVAVLLSAGPTLAVGRGGSVPPDDRRRGVVHAGLTGVARGGPCDGKLELAHRDRVGNTTVEVCTHGPDPAPDGVDARRRRPTSELVPAAAAGPEGAGVALAQAGIPCYGTGSDGYRVQVIYARASDVPDRYAALATSLVQWSAAVDQVFNASAGETGGIRHVRFVTDAACNLVIDRVNLSVTGDDDFSSTVAELRTKGYTRVDRKYLVYTDANVYCGIGQLYSDDSVSATPGSNQNNGHAEAPGMVARVDNGCWGLPDAVEAHELMHTLGGVQSSAPHVTPNSHCSDEYDRLCYADDIGVTIQYVCPLSHEGRFDCNHDDYYSTNPPAGSYLATHWNTANSAFLARTEPGVTLTRAWTWGLNQYGQVGDGTTTSRSTPVLNVVEGASSVAAGGFHSLALTSGTVWSWGLGHVGQLGRGIITSSPTPGQVSGLTGVTAISGGVFHSLALKADGTVWSWGYNAYGQLGDGSTTDRSAPVQVSGLAGVVAISAGATHNLALKGDGSVWSWGSNSVGQLGRTAPEVASTAAVVPGLTGITSLAAGGYHSLVVRPGGTVAAFGYNPWGQLGDGTFVDRATPVTVTGLSGVSSVSAGIGHSLAVGTDGTVRTWGFGHAGQLGRVLPAGTVVSPTAAVVPGLTGVAKVVGAGYHSEALRTTGTVAAWGWNVFGQLGDGTTTDRTSPVAVTGLAGVLTLSSGVAHNLVTSP